jgi:hypothetical protein
MSEAETLKLIAEVSDKFSGPLRELQKALQGFRLEGEKHTREQGRQDEILNRNVREPRDYCTTAWPLPCRPSGLAWLVLPVSFPQ